MVNRGRLGWVGRVIRDVGPWEGGGKISLISRDGQFVSCFGVKSGIPSVFMGLEELYVGLVEGEEGVLGDADRFGVISQSIRLKMVNYA